MTIFDAEEIERRGWRQGAVLGPKLAERARAGKPSGIEVDASDWFIVVSHDCDVVNHQLDKEPTVELLRARVFKSGAPDKQQLWGRNPRSLELLVEGSKSACLLRMRVHERWTIPRESLMEEEPLLVLEEKPRRAIAEWLAKRYIRAAFPSSFDARWRLELRAWTKLLQKHSELLQGVYLRLSTLKELPPETPYRLHFMVAVPAARAAQSDWAQRKDALELEIESFWNRFSGIECVGVEARGTDDLTLAEIEAYLRFDADWVSFADDSPGPVSMADLTT